MTDAFDLAADRLCVGTVGQVGSRLFLIQCRQGETMLTLKVEKQHLPDDQALEQPVEPAWAVGTIGVSFDESEDRVVLVIEELVPEGEVGAIARVSITREQAAAFTIQATRLIESGRPPCPLCGSPLDPSGHECPRTNGHRPPVV